MGVRSPGVFSGSIARRVAACWGNGDYGRLGHGSACLSEEIPRVVASLANQVITAVACGGAHTAVVSGDGSVYTMGLNDQQQLGHSSGEQFVAEPREVLLPEPVTAVAAGHYHTLCLAESGNVWAFGGNAHGQLGLGRSAASVETLPRRINGLAGERVTQIVAGAEHSLALTAAGDVFSWGAGADGRLGHGPPVRSGSWDEATPRAITSLSGVASLAASMTHSGCVLQDSRCFMWGAKLRQTLTETAAFLDVPQQVEGLQGMVQLALGGGHALALRHTGQALVWGTNEHGVLGLGSGAPPNPRLPLPLEKPHFEKVAAGWKHSVGVTGGGALWAWGWGGSVGTASVLAPTHVSSGGQLGIGDDNDRWEPAAVKNLAWGDEVVHRGAQGDPTWRVVEVACGFNHTAAVIEILV